MNGYWFLLKQNFLCSIKIVLKCLLFAYSARCWLFFSSQLSNSIRNSKYAIVFSFGFYVYCSKCVFMMESDFRNPNIMVIRDYITVETFMLCCVINITQIDKCVVFSLSSIVTVGSTLPSSFLAKWEFEIKKCMRCCIERKKNLSHWRMLRKRVTACQRLTCLIWI